MKQWLLTCLLLATPLGASELIEVAEVSLRPGKGAIQIVQEQGVLFAEVRLLASDVLGTQFTPNDNEGFEAAEKRKEILSQAKNVFEFDKQTRLKTDIVLDAFYSFELEDDVIETLDGPQTFIVEFELEPVSKQDTITLYVKLFKQIPSLSSLSVTVINLGDERRIELTPSKNSIQL